MGGLISALGNRTARTFTLFGIFLTAAVLVCTGLLHRYENREAAAAETGYRLAIAGRLAEAGLSDTQIAELITAETTPEHTAAGERILAKYGYSAGSPVGGEYAYTTHIASGLLAAAGTLVCTFFGMLCFSAVFRSLRTLTAQLEQDEKITYPDDRDITLLAEAAAELKRQTAHLVGQLGEEKQYLADYLNDFSHQIKTPCTGLSLNNDILSSAPMDFEEQLGYFKRDRKCLDRISLLVGASLKLARLDAGAVEYDFVTADISEPVAEAVTQLAAIAEENGAELINEVKRGTELRFDRLWFCEAVTNLIKNAAEHTHGGQVHIRAESDPLTVRLFIEDNGCGISEEELPKVFHRFYSRSGAVNPNSVGIGMSAAKRIIEDMGGRIFIESEQGKGTKIILEFLRTVT